MSTCPVIEEFSVPLKVMPMPIGDGGRAYYMPDKWRRKLDERYVGLSYIAQRQLFGMAYGLLAGRYYHQMGQGSGVLIAPFLDIDKVIPSATFPGDIDLLILPYEGDRLIVSRALAVEIKVVRATFLKQGKSPNEFGFSQAKALLSLGFPFAAVAHLIVSDKSPARHWRKVAVTTMLNSETGEVEPLSDFYTDMLPADLMQRCYGRLVQRCSDESLGLLASYFDKEGCWVPEGRAASFNSETSQFVLEALADFYWRNPARFLLTPKFPLSKHRFI